MTKARPRSRLQPQEEVPDDLARLGIEVARGLVGEDQPRLADERPCDGHPLLLAARQLARAVRQPVAEPDLLEGRRRPLARLAAVTRWSRAGSMAFSSAVISPRRL